MKKDKATWIVVTMIFAILFLIDLLIPDPLPFIDEILLFLATIITGVRTIW